MASVKIGEQNMKKRVLWLWALLVACSMEIHAVSVTITDGIDNNAIKTKMENTIARILNEANAAQAAHRSLNSSAIGVNDYVQLSLSSLWENSPFICADEEIVEHCITTGNGYQIRNIPLLMKPTGERPFNEDDYQEAVVSFDKLGNMVSFYLTISTNLYMKVIKSDLKLTDLRRRQLILDWVEHFRTAYNQKDIDFLNQVFSDDALIITGNVITQKHPEGYMTQKVRYNKQSKVQYLNNLRRVFQRNSYIYVDFDDIEVIRHTNNPNIYGVTLFQGWTSGNYHDKGYLFLIWDFTDENVPQVHVRTWQPEKFEGRTITRDEVFTLGDFDIN